MADLTTINLPDFVDTVERKFIKEMESVIPAARNSGLFIVDAWEPGTGDTRTYSEIDLEEYASIKDESDDAEAAKVQQGYTKTSTPRRFGKDITISWEMRKRNKYPEVNKRITNLSKLVANKMELDLQHRITFGTATSYTDKDGRTVTTTTGDGLALFSTAHTLNGSSTTYRNRLAGNAQLSKGALEGAEVLAVEQTLNQFGEKMSMSFDILFTTDDPNTVNTARELLQSTAEVSAPNNGVLNVYQGKYKHVILPLIATDANGNVDSTKAKYWGIASSTDTSAYLSVEEEPNIIPPEMGSNSEDVSSEDWTFKGRGSYAICIVGARWIKFSSGDGTA